MYTSPFGKQEGLSTRLDKWAADLGKHSFPWLGLGLIHDLRAAAALLEGRPVPIDPHEEKSEPEYDL